MSMIPIIIIIVIMRDNSEKYAGSVMVVVVDKGRTIETRQDVSFIPQTTSDKEASWTFLIDLRSHSPQKRDKNWTKNFQTNKKKKWSLSFICQPIKKLLDIFDRFMFPQLKNCHSDLHMYICLSSVKWRLVDNVYDIL